MVASPRIKHPLMAIGVVAACAGFPASAFAEHTLCPKVQNAVDGYARRLSDGRTLSRLAPYMGDSAAADLGVHLAAGDDERRYDILMALFATRQGSALRVASQPLADPGPLAHLGRALALLGLGNGSETGTIAFALAAGPIELRRRAARALGQMRQVRPQTMLYEALEDEDPEVRLWAGRSLLPTGSTKARRALVDLARVGPRVIRLRAARTLADERVRTRPEDLDKLPEPMRGRLLVSEVARGRRAIDRRLPSMLGDADGLRRAAAFAALAFAESPVRMRKLASTAVKRFGAAAEAELGMALALAGEADGYAALDKADAAAAGQAVAVLWAFTGAGERRASRPVEDARRIAKRVERWLKSGRLGDKEASRALRALEVLDPSTAAETARVRLRAGDGWGLRTSLRILGRHGEDDDVPLVVAAANRELEARTQAEAWRAAARICVR